MFNITIIGAGQLGSRHLQGLALIDIPVNIQVLDTSLTSLEVAKERYNQMALNDSIKSISFLQSIDDLPTKLDLVIIATNANVRCFIIKELLAKRTVSDFVLEKVVFQNVSDFEDVTKLFADKGIKAWVNCPRRMFPFYKELKSKLSNDGPISISVQGGNWGLACNSIHYFDLLSDFSNSSKLKVSTDFLDKEILDSKRAGYIELSGLLLGQIDDNRISLYSGKSEGSIIMTIKSDSYLLILEEGLGYCRISDLKSNWMSREESTKIVYFQSELSHIFAKDILLKRECDLTSFKESYDIHKAFLKEILKYYNNMTNAKNKLCPIT